MDILDILLKPPQPFIGLFLLIQGPHPLWGWGVGGVGIWRVRDDVGTF